MTKNPWTTTDNNFLLNRMKKAKREYLYSGAWDISLVDDTKITIERNGSLSWFPNLSVKFYRRIRLIQWMMLQDAWPTSVSLGFVGKVQFGSGVKNDHFVLRIKCDHLEIERAICAMVKHSLVKKLGPNYPSLSSIDPTTLYTRSSFTPASLPSGNSTRITRLRKRRLTPLWSIAASGQEQWKITKLTKFLPNLPTSHNPFHHLS